MTIKLEICPPYPDGFNSYTWVRVTWVRLARIPFLKEAALRFARNRDHTLQLEREPSNEYDPNAIKVIGHSKGLVSRESAHIGYVPRNTATCIVEGGYWGIVEPSFGRIHVNDEYDGGGYWGTVEPGLGKIFVGGEVGGEDPSMRIEFRLLGPVAQKKAFRKFHYIVEQRKLRWREATTLQKEFYRMFDYTIPYRLLHLDATKLINKKTAELRKKDESALHAWRHYSHIVEQLSNPRERILNNIREVSITRLRLAVVELVNEGRTLEEMADDIKIVTERLVKLHPKLKCPSPTGVPHADV
jgi:hypothetical protein